MRWHATVQHADRASRHVLGRPPSPSVPPLPKPRLLVASIHPPIAHRTFSQRMLCRVILCLLWDAALHQRSWYNEARTMQWLLSSESCSMLYAMCVLYVVSAGLCILELSFLLIIVSMFLAMSRESAGYIYKICVRLSPVLCAALCCPCIHVALHACVLNLAGSENIWAHSDHAAEWNAEYEYIRTRVRLFVSKYQNTWIPRTCQLSFSTQLIGSGPASETEDTTSTIAKLRTMSWLSTPRLRNTRHTTPHHTEHAGLGCVLPDRY